MLLKWIVFKILRPCSSFVFCWPLQRSCKSKLWNLFKKPSLWSLIHSGRYPHHAITEILFTLITITKIAKICSSRIFPWKTAQITHHASNFHHITRLAKTLDGHVVTSKKPQPRNHANYWGLVRQELMNGFALVS